ncbi:hypothetical protein OESDEN_15296 [Oesophagostomum dentatum]|uniref:EF-hand domain-containing protein n=1 Tax=Oesophagostomum dentatum TaxID=61180 RepID=A0A0B1SJ89_OESDE|nr:hypothetical protein OESDEN_15296 [Oesophagostomum dentatum]
MSPDPKGRVDLAAFHEYVRSIFTLYGSREEVDATAALGLPSGSMSRRATVAECRPFNRNIKRFATERFRALDTNHDGFITVEDVEREFQNSRNFLLMSRRDMEEAAKKSEPSDSSE